MPTLIKLNSGHVALVVYQQLVMSSGPAHLLPDVSKMIEAGAEALATALGEALEVIERPAPSDNEEWTWDQILATEDPALFTPYVSAGLDNGHGFFSAAPWLAQAPADKIVALYGNGWAEEAGSQEIANYMRGRSYVVAQELRKAPPGQGLAWVDDGMAMEWLRSHRIGVYARVICEENGIDLVQAQGPDGDGRWDWLVRDASDANEESFETAEAAALNALVKMNIEPELADEHPDAFERPKAR